MKIALTEKQLKSITSSLSTETDVDEQNEPVSAEPKTGASEKQAGGDGYPEVTKWSDIVGSKLTRGPANQLGNTKWSEVVGTQLTRGAENQLKEHVFDAHITTNGRYLILQDQVFDIQEQKNMGNIWDSIDTFKSIFKNTDSEIEGYKEIQEGILNLPILESGDNLQAMKQVILEFDLFKDTWIGRELASSGESLKDFGKESWKGIKQMGVAIGEGEWLEVLKMLKQGVIYVVRKLKQALYSDIGMIVDAILVSTGIGKAVPFVAWALVVALDIYELSSGDVSPGTEDEPQWTRYMELAFDVMGMVVAGAAAKSVRKVFSGLFAWVKKGGKAPAWFAKNPAAKKVVDQMLSALNKAPELLRRASKYLGRKFGEGAKLITGVLNKMGNFFNNLKATLKALVGGNKVKLGTKVKAGLGAGGMTAGMAYGIDKLTGNDKNQLQPATSAAFNYDAMPNLATFDIGDDL